MSIGLGGEGDSGDSSGDGGSGGSGGGHDSSGLSSPYPLHSGLVNFWDSILVSIISITASIAVYFIIRHLLKRTADSLNLDKRELKGINSITKMILIVINIIIIIFQFSSVSGVAAGAISVAAGTIIGFSSRNTISNAIAGILLLSSRPFKIGDRIRTTEDDSLVGDVIEISLLYTKIKTVRNELVAIPNQTLLQRQIVNYSGLDILATSIEVSAIYNNNRDRVESLLVEAAKNTDGIITDNPTPFVLLKRFENYAAVYELRAYTNKPNEYLKIQSEIRKKIYDLFQRYELDLTIPQAQINVDNKKEERENRNTRTNL
jgi:small-conductance mechanosensitive channel